MPNEHCSSVSSVLKVHTGCELPQHDCLHTPEVIQVQVSKMIEK